MTARDLGVGRAARAARLAAQMRSCGISRFGRAVQTHRIRRAGQVIWAQEGRWGLSALSELEEGHMERETRLELATSSLEG